MSWTDRTGKKPDDKPDFMDAMLPPGFADDLKNGTPKDAMLAKLQEFMRESEKFVAAEEGRAPELTPPTPEYLESVFALYSDLARHTDA